MRDRKILIVDFEEKCLNSLSKFFQDQGFNIVTAKDGQEGLKKFELESPDLVILEPMLLKLHGFDLCKKISDDSAKKIPIIIVTGYYRGEHYKTEAIQSFGASGFFEKPCKNEEILSTIKDLIGEKTEEKLIEEEKEVIQTPERISKTDTKAEIRHEVDEMLKEAFSEFGLNLDKKTQHIHDDQRKLEKEEIKEKEKTIEGEVDLEKEVHKKEHGPYEAYFSKTKKPFRPLSIIEIFKKIKKPVPQLVVPIFIAGLALGFASFHFLKPKKVDSYPRENASLILPNLPQEQKDDQAEEDLTQLPINTEEKEKNISVSQTLEEGLMDEQIQESSLSSEAETDSNNQIEVISSSPSNDDITPIQPSYPEISSEYIEPIPPPDTPLVEVQELPIFESESSNSELKEQANPSEETSHFEEQITSKMLAQINKSPTEIIKTGDLIPLDMVDTLPMAIKKVSPQYPQAALGRGIEETVVIKALISENGDVIKTSVIKVAKSPLGFNRASEKAVKQWKFTPALKDGVKVKVWKSISILFKKI